MNRYPKKHDECEHELTSDFSYFELNATERTKHIYCHNCGTHWLKNKVWKADKWEKWINEG